MLTRRIAWNLAAAMRRRFELNQSRAKLRLGTADMQGQSKFAGFLLEKLGAALIRREPSIS